MPPKYVVRPAAAKPATEAAKVEVPPTAKLGLGAFVAALLGVLWYVTTESSLDLHSRALAANFGIVDVNVNVVYNAKGRPSLAAKSTLAPGQFIMSVPAESIVDFRLIGQSPVGEFIQHENATIVNQYAQENKMTTSMFNVISFAYYFVVEKRKGSSSKLAPFFAIVKEPTDSAIYWDASILPCFDMAINAEVRELSRTLDGAVGLAEKLCSIDEAAARVNCKGNPFTRDELKYAIGLYLQHNFQDQAFIPLLSFAQYDNARPSVNPQFDQKQELLAFASSAPLKRGEPVTLSFLRGPNQLITSREEFDGENARGVEVALQIPPEDEAAKAACGQITELQFAPNGRPREALVNCMFVLVTSDPSVRKKIAKNRKLRTDELSAYVFGNLTVAALRLSEMDQAYDAKACSDAAERASDSAAISLGQDYLRWRQSVMKSNTQYVEQQMREKYAAAKLPMPDPRAAPQPSDIDVDAAPPQEAPSTDAEL